MAKNRNNPTAKKPHANIASQRSKNPLLYIGSLIVLVIIAVTFIGAPAIGRIAGGRSSVVFGSYDGTDIEYRQGNYFDRQMISISQQRRAASATSNTEADARAVMREAFRRTTFRTATLAETTRANLDVSEEQIDKELIRSGPYVEGGEFNEDRYNATSVSQRKKNRRLVEEKLIERQFFSDLSSVRTSSEATNFFRNMVTTERRFHIAVFPFEGLPEKQLREYGTAHPHLFRQIKLSRIMFRPNSGEAVEVLNRLRDQSSTFEELSRLYSVEDRLSGGDIGWKYSFDIGLDFDDEAVVESIFSLLEGEFTDVLKSYFGDVIYRADASVIAPDFNDDEVLSAVQDYLARYQRGVITDYYTQQAAQFRVDAQADDFFAVASGNNIQIVQTEFFPINYQDVVAVRSVQAIDSDALQNAASYEEFFIRAFRLTEDEISEPVILDDKVLVLRMIEQRQAEKEIMGLVENYHPYFVASAMDRDLQSSIYSNELFIDRFDEGYQRLITSMARPAQPPPSQALF